MIVSDTYGKCCGGEKEKQSGEGEEVHSYSSREQLGRSKSAGVGVRYKLLEIVSNFS